MKLEKIKNKKILVLGLGKEGIDVLKFLKTLFPEKEISAGDIDKKIKRDVSKVKYYLGDDYLKNIKRYNLIIKSPGIPLHQISPLVKKGTVVTSATDIFLNNCEGLVIGITGTKGKSTTATIIYNILKKSGFKAELIGNIGKPMLSYLLKDNPSKIYICELSSFQLASVTKSPQIAILLNIFKDHLDHHKNFKEYLECKKNIFRYQSKDDFLLFNEKDSLVKKMVKGVKPEKIAFSGREELFEAISSLFKIPLSIVDKEVQEFKNLPNRLEFVGRYNGISFYNDSAATIPEATINAISLLGDDLETLIVGGVDKGFDFKELRKRISQSRIKNLICFPETGPVIARGLSERINKFYVDKMSDAVDLAYQKTGKKKISVLSPGASSFNLFKNYKERGNIFKRCVKKFSKK